MTPRDIGPTFTVELTAEEARCLLDTQEVVKWSALAVAAAELERIQHAR